MLFSYLCVFCLSVTVLLPACLLSLLMAAHLCLCFYVAESRLCSPPAVSMSLFPSPRLCPPVCSRRCFVLYISAILPSEMKLKHLHHFTFSRQTSLNFCMFVLSPGRRELETSPPRTSCEITRKLASCLVYLLIARFR